MGGVEGMAGWDWHFSAYSTVEIWVFCEVRFLCRFSLPFFLLCVVFQGSLERWGPRQPPWSSAA